MFVAGEIPRQTFGLPPLFQRGIKTFLRRGTPFEKGELRQHQPIPRPNFVGAPLSRKGNFTSRYTLYAICYTLSRKYPVSPIFIGEPPLYERGIKPFFGEPPLYKRGITPVGGWDSSRTRNDDKAVMLSDSPANRAG